MLLIVGVGRSGTSLLQSMLNAHSDICFLPETQFLRNYVINRPSKKIENPSEKELLISALNNDDSFQRSEIDAKLLVEIGDTYADIYDKFLNTYRERKEKELVGDKDPRIIDFISGLVNLKGALKVIHIMRDPRAVVASRMKADWSKKWPFFMHIFLYRAQFERGRSQGNALFGQNYHELYYEELIASPREQLDQICDFLKVPCEPEMLNFQNSARELIDKKEYQWKKETTGPLLSANADKWRKSLSKKQVYLIESVCNTIFKDHIFVRTPKHKVGFGTLIKSLLLRPAAWTFAMLYPLRGVLKK
ncbi:MAG: sulfotransferase [Roseivirga sp.]|nr:sulfotransferase [Roseivirga sp.]